MAKKFERSIFKYQMGKFLKAKVEEISKIETLKSNFFLYDDCTGCPKVKCIF